MIAMSKTKGQTFRYRFGNETKTFWYRSRICLVENRLFRFGPESVLLDQIDMISFDGADLGTKTQFWFNSCEMLERLSFTVMTYYIMEHFQEIFRGGKYFFGWDLDEFTQIRLSIPCYQVRLRTDRTVQCTYVYISTGAITLFQLIIFFAIAANNGNAGNNTFWYPCKCEKAHTIYISNLFEHFYIMRSDSCTALPRSILWSRLCQNAPTYPTCPTYNTTYKRKNMWTSLFCAWENRTDWGSRLQLPLLKVMVWNELLPGRKKGGGRSWKFVHCKAIIYMGKFTAPRCSGGSIFAWRIRMITFWKKIMFCGMFNL